MKYYLFENFEIPFSLSTFSLFSGSYQFVFFFSICFVFIVCHFDSSEASFSFLAIF